MRALFDGEEGSEEGVTRYKGADGSLNVMLVNDDGSNIDITGDTVTIEIHTSAVRSASPVATFTGVIVAAAAGYYTVALAAVSMTFGPGTHYMFAKRVHLTKISYGTVASKLVVK